MLIHAMKLNILTFNSNVSKGKNDFQINFKTKTQNQKTFALFF